MLASSRRTVGVFAPPWCCPTAFVGIASSLGTRNTMASPLSSPDASPKFFPELLKGFCFQAILVCRALWLLPAIVIFLHASASRGRPPHRKASSVTCSAVSAKPAFAPASAPITPPLKRSQSAYLPAIPLLVLRTPVPLRRCSLLHSSQLPAVNSMVSPSRSTSPRAKPQSQIQTRALTGRSSFLSLVFLVTLPTIAFLTQRSTRFPSSGSSVPAPCSMWAISARRLTACWFCGKPILGIPRFV